MPILRSMSGAQQNGSGIADVMHAEAY